MATMGRLSEMGIFELKKWNKLEKHWRKCQEIEKKIWKKKFNTLKQTIENDKNEKSNEKHVYNEKNKYKNVKLIQLNWGEINQNWNIWP